MSINNLRSKPLWQLTGEELLDLLGHKNTTVMESYLEASKGGETEEKYVYGYAGIAKLFNCSIPTAARIKSSGKIDKAITQIGRKIIVDAKLALELAKKRNGGRN